MNVYCFMCDYYVALISAFVLLKCGIFKNNCSGLKTDWDIRPPPPPPPAIYGMRITSLHLHFVVLHKLL